MRGMTTILLLLAGAFIAHDVRADEELANAPIVAAGWHGECYAKSVPDAYDGEAGRTTIYTIGRDKDVPAASYPWYARNLHLWCGGPNLWPWKETTVVRVGTWPRGRLANKRELAVAFYRGGKLLRRYSTLDIAGKPGAVRVSVSHHTVFADIEGVVWEGHPHYPVFLATRVDGKVLRFSLKDGALIE